MLGFKVVDVNLVCKTWINHITNNNGNTMITNFQLVMTIRMVPIQHDYQFESQLPSLKLT